MFITFKDGFKIPWGSIQNKNKFLEKNFEIINLNHISGIRSQAFRLYHDNKPLYMHPITNSHREKRLSLECHKIESGRDLIGIFIAGIS